MYSDFDNDNDILRWSNGFFAPGSPTNYDRSVLPPDNRVVEDCSKRKHQGPSVEFGSIRPRHV